MQDNETKGTGDASTKASSQESSSAQGTSPTGSVKDSPSATLQPNSIAEAIAFAGAGTVEKTSTAHLTLPMMPPQGVGYDGIVTDAARVNQAMAERRANLRLGDSPDDNVIMAGRTVKEVAAMSRGELPDGSFIEDTRQLERVTVAEGTATPSGVSGAVEFTRTVTPAEQADASTGNKAEKPATGGATGGNQGSGDTSGGTSGAGSA